MKYWVDHTITIRNIKLGFLVRFLFQAPAKEFRATITLQKTCISSYLQIASYFQFLSQEVASLLHLLSLFRPENFQQNNLRFFPQWEGFLPQTSVISAVNWGSVCFSLNSKIECKIFHIQIYKTTENYLQIFQVTLRSSILVNLLVCQLEIWRNRATVQNLNDWNSEQRHQVICNDWNLETISRWKSHLVTHPEFASVTTWPCSNVPPKIQCGHEEPFQAILLTWNFNHTSLHMFTMYTVCTVPRLHLLHQSQSDLPIVCHGWREFAPTHQHRFATSRVAAGRLGLRLGVLEPICLQQQSLRTSWRCANGFLCSRLFHNSQGCQKWNEQNVVTRQFQQNNNLRLSVHSAYRTCSKKWMAQVRR